MTDAQETLAAPDRPPGDDAAAAGKPIGPFRRDALFPGYYTWMVFLAALDVMLTWVILFLEGHELNPFAAYAIKHFKLRGIVFLKLGTLALVLWICETVGRRRYATGRRLVRWASVILAAPVFVQCVLMVIVLTRSPAAMYREMQEAIEGEAIPPPASRYSPRTLPSHLRTHEPTPRPGP